jgi:hypothetical protein
VEDSVGSDRQLNLPDVHKYLDYLKTSDLQVSLAAESLFGVGNGLSGGPLNLPGPE